MMTETGERDDARDYLGRLDRADAPGLPPDTVASHTTRYSASGKADGKAEQIDKHFIYSLVIWKWDS